MDGGGGGGGWMVGGGGGVGSNTSRDRCASVWREGAGEWGGGGGGSRPNLRPKQNKKHAHTQPPSPLPPPPPPPQHTHTPPPPNVSTNPQLCSWQNHAHLLTLHYICPTLSHRSCCHPDSKTLPFVCLTMALSHASYNGGI